MQNRTNNLCLIFGLKFLFSHLFEFQSNFLLMQNIGSWSHIFCFNGACKNCINEKQMYIKSVILIIATDCEKENKKFYQFERKH